MVSTTTTYKIWILEIEFHHLFANNKTTWLIHVKEVQKKSTVPELRFKDKRNFSEEALLSILRMKQHFYSTTECTRLKQSQKPIYNPDHLLKATPKGPDHHKLPHSSIFIASYGPWTRVVMQGTTTYTWAKDPNMWQTTSFVWVIRRYNQTDPPHRHLCILTWRLSANQTGLAMVSEVKGSAKCMTQATPSVPQRINQ